MSTRFTEERLRALDAAHPGLSDRLGKEPDSVLVRESGLPQLTVWRWRWSLGIPAHTKSGKKRRTTVRLRDPRAPKPDALAPVRAVAAAWPDDPDAREVVRQALSEHSRAVVAHALDLTVKVFSAKLETYDAPAPEPRKNRLTPEKLEARYPGILARLSRETDPVVGAAYGITRSYVQSVRVQLCLTSRQLQREATYLSDVVPLLATTTTAAICEKLGIKPNVVQRLRRKHGVPEPTVERPKHIPPSKAYDLRVSTNMTWTEIKEACGFTSTPTAIRSARLYALATGKPWPVDVPRRRQKAARRVGTDETETPSRLSTMQLGISVPLSSLSVLADAFGRSNRTTKDALVRRIGEGFNASVVGTLILLRRKSDGKVFIIDGHHRHDGMCLHCEINGVDPNAFMVTVNLYEEDDVPDGMDAASFIDEIRDGMHDRVPESFTHAMQRRWISSPWKIGFDQIGREPKYTGDETITLKMVVQARLMADEIKARFRANPLDPTAVLNRLPGAPRKKAILDALSHYPTVDAMRTVQIVNKWDLEVGSTSGPGRGNFRTIICLIFAILVAEDPKNARRPDIFSKLSVSPKEPIRQDKGSLVTFSELLHRANLGNRVNWIYLLGRNAYGNYVK